jgi:cytochrome P450
VSGAEKVVAEVRQHNDELAEFAREVIAERRAERERHNDFLSSLRVPVRRREDAPSRSPSCPSSGDNRAARSRRSRNL